MVDEERARAFKAAIDQVLHGLEQPASLASSPPQEADMPTKAQAKEVVHSG